MSTRPPFALGNLVGARSGAWSDRLVRQTVEELRPRLQALINDAPWIGPLDVDALEDYLYDRARLTRLETWLAENGDRYPDTDRRAGDLRDRDLREVASLRRRCMDHRARLGFDPASRARMNLDRVLAVDVAALMADLEIAADQPEDLQ